MADAIWKTKDGTMLPMSKMDIEHLQKAYTHACMKELVFCRRANLFAGFQEELEEEAAKRGIILQYPNVTAPNPKYNKWFQDKDKTKKMPVDKPQALLGTTEDLKEINT